MTDETPDTLEEEMARRPKPVPKLPIEGDQSEFEEEPVPDEAFEPHEEVAEPREPPNDLSEIEREFDDS